MICSVSCGRVAKRTERIPSKAAPSRMSGVLWPRDAQPPENTGNGDTAGRLRLTTPFSKSPSITRFKARSCAMTDPAPKSTKTAARMPSLLGGLRIGTARGFFSTLLRCSQHAVTIPKGVGNEDLFINNTRVAEPFRAAQQTCSANKEPSRGSSRRRIGPH